MSYLDTHGLGTLWDKMKSWTTSQGYLTSVTWNDVGGKPSTFPPSSHNHDDRYYTEAEVDTALGGKANTSHTHTKSQITDFPSIPTKTSDLTNDSGFLTEHQSLSAYRISADQDTIDATKVDKVEGKGLSTNDYDNAEKGLVASALQPSALTPYRTSSAQDAIDATKQGLVDLSIVDGKLCVTYEEE